MLLRQAAAIPNPGLEKDSQQIAAAHFVLRSAQDESASRENQEDSAEPYKGGRRRIQATILPTSRKTIGWRPIAAQPVCT
jgi:hypothetical protein